MKYDTKSRTVEETAKRKKLGTFILVREMRVYPALSLCQLK